MEEVLFINTKNEKISLINGETYYILPFSGKISISPSEETFFFNDDVYENIGKATIFEIKDKNIKIDTKKGIYEIIVLTEEFSEQVKKDYVDFSNELKNFSDSRRITEKSLWELLEREKDYLNICSFSKILEDASSNSDISDVLKLVPALPHIFHKPKQHLKQIEEVRPVAAVSRIGQESIKHLASHSEHWKAIKANGLEPERLLAKSLEDDLEIYENKAVKKLVDFLIIKESKEKLLTIEILNQLDEQATNNVFSFEQNTNGFYEAQRILLKGMDNDDIELRDELMKENKSKLSTVLNYLVECKNSKNYRKLRKTKFLEKSLNKTNIFMMDPYYNQAYKLWNLVHKGKEESIKKEKLELTDEYFSYCKILLIFALHYSGFTLINPDAQVFSNGKLTVKYKKSDLELTVEYPENFTDFIQISIQKETIYKIRINDLGISLPPQLKSYFIYENGYLITRASLNGVEQNKIISLIEDQWSKKEVEWKSRELRKRLHDTFSKQVSPITKLYFLAWKFPFPDDEIQQREMFKKFATYFDGEEMKYIFSPNRPTNFENISDKALLETTLSYGNAYEEYGIKNTNIGFIPVSISDMNSYRRISKIILNGCIKAESEFCPICNNNIIQMGNEKTCSKCGFTIRKTVCANCHRDFDYSDYKLPKVQQYDNDEISPGTQVVLDELHLGFKNITNAKILDGRIHPICPYCGKY